MKVYIDKQDVGQARILDRKMTGGHTEQYLAGCKCIEFSEIPEPDRTDLSLTLDKIIREEGKRGNKVDAGDLYIMYSIQRYEELRRGGFVMERSDGIVQTPEQKAQEASEKELAEKYEATTEEEDEKQKIATDYLGNRLDDLVKADRRKGLDTTWHSKWLVNPKEIN
jgi:hypothetical protein